MNELDTILSGDAIGPQQILIVRDEETGLVAQSFAPTTPITTSEISQYGLVGRFR